MTDLAKVVRLEVTNERLTKARLTQIAGALQRCLEQSRIFLTPLIESCLDRFDDQLFNLADKSPNNQDQNTYFNAMRRVRQQRSAFLKRFSARLQEAFARLDGTEVTPANPPNTDTLALMRYEELDELIAVESMITQAHRAHADAIAQLSFRMNGLGAVSIYARNNPIGPESLCQMLTGAALQFDVPSGIKLILIKAFDLCVFSSLGALYQELNELLNQERGPAQAGFSEISSAEKKPLASKLNEKTNKVPGNNTDSAPHNLGIGGSFDDELASVLNELAQSGDSDGRQISRSLSTVAFVDILNELQRQIISEESVLQPNDLIAAISQYQGQNIELTRNQRETVHLVSLLFQFILNEKNLAPEIIHLLSQLQVATCKVALIDNDFFAQKGHGVRRLLNEMALSSVGWAGNLNDPLYLKIESIVATIRQQFDRDPAIFTRLLTEFTAFIEKEKCRAALCERRLVDAEDGKARADKARKRVSVEVGLRTDGFLLAEPLREFIFTVWFQVLFVRCLRAGNDSLPWRDGLQTLTDLVWSVQPLTTVKDRQALIMMVPNLMERLRLGLEDIAFDPFASADFFSLLNRLHRDAVAGFSPSKKIETITRVQDGAAKPIPPEAVAVLSTELIIDLGSDDLHWQQVATFAPGSWFDIIEPEKPVLRCRLAAVIKQTGNFIFVNRSGVKVAERHHQQLALALKSGQLRPIDSSLLFDRALEEIVAGLRKTAKSPLELPEAKRDKKE